MQEASKFPHASRKHSAVDVPPDTLQKKDAREATEAPKLKVTLERPESLAALDQLETADARPAPELHTHTKQARSRDAARTAHNGRAGDSRPGFTTQRTRQAHSESLTIRRRWFR